MRGTVKFYSEEKKFGYIVGDDGRDYYLGGGEVHSQLRPSPGASVRFEPCTNARGPIAKNVMVFTVKPVNVPDQLQTYRENAAEQAGNSRRGRQIMGGLLGREVSSAKNVASKASSIGSTLNRASKGNPVTAVLTGLKVISELAAGSATSKPIGVNPSNIPKATSKIEPTQSWPTLDAQTEGSKSQVSTDEHIKKVLEDAKRAKQAGQNSLLAASVNIILFLSFNMIITSSILASCAPGSSTKHNPFFYTIGIFITIHFVRKMLVKKFGNVGQYASLGMLLLAVVAIGQLY